MRSSTAKEKILKKIRSALLEKHDNPYPNNDNVSLYPPSGAYLDILFAEELIKVNGEFIFCTDVVDFLESLINLTEQKQWSNIYCWESSLQQLFDECHFPYIGNDKNFIDNAEVGITTCEALIARNGSVMLSSVNESGRRLSIYPHCHIVVAFASQLVLDLKDAFLLIKERYGNTIPSMISTITGPSRTADIEKTLVLGAHGPKELFVFLIQDNIY